MKTLHTHVILSPLGGRRICGIHMSLATDRFFRRFAPSD